MLLEMVQHDLPTSLQPCYNAILYGNFLLQETVARRRFATLLSGFGLGYVREYFPSALTLSTLHLILRSKSQHI